MILGVVLYGKMRADGHGPNLTSDEISDVMYDLQYEATYPTKCLSSAIDSTQYGVVA